MDIPQLGSKLTKDHIAYLEAFTKSCRYSILAMVNQAQSGHPGGSCSCVDYLAVVHNFLLAQNGQPIVVSNGHISPGVYSVLAELGYIPKQEVIDTFRRVGSIYEGHVTRHVPGVWFGTGPLGIGVSAASGFALSERLRGTGKHVYALIGDGEAQEGQVYEMMHFAAKYKLDNFIVFVDYNLVQLSDSLAEIMPLDIVKTFDAAGWHVLEVDGHDYQKIWSVLGDAHKVKNKPVVIVGHTIMGKGIDLLEPDGIAHKATWHGKSPKPEQSLPALEKLKLDEQELKLVESFREHITWRPEKPEFRKLHVKLDVNIGEPTLYEAGTVTDCRSAYGAALVDLVRRNKQIVALTADLRDSVKTDGVAKEFPDRHIEVGIAEQHMVSCSGGMSLDGLIPFCSTFGAFMSSRAKDQARVNDINDTNVKMVATHCGLSVGEDGPTHQAIDDMSSFLGILNTGVIEPADANQTDRIIRYVAGHYGNFYVRMGRHKFPVITKEDGSVFYDADYQYIYGRTDVVRDGSDVTIAATGPMVLMAIIARDELKKILPNASVEIIAVSSIKKFDQTVVDSVRKTGKLITVEDHNSTVGLSSQLTKHLIKAGVHLKAFHGMGVSQYQLSGTAEELYRTAGISHENIVEAVQKMVG